jgi:hypothetical protein
MSDVPEFGSLSPVGLRECWPDEARDLTPWLASDDGIALLGQTLGLSLVCEGTEVAAGPFSADILARDLSSDALVVIENQLEKTDHDHFGKVLTYAAVLNASTVIWIAKKFTEEHRKAVEWLNELVSEDELVLYGIELQVWKIGDSTPAPRLEVVCGPNQAVHEANRVREAANASPTRQLQLEFWSAVRSQLEQTDEFSSLRQPGPRNYFDIALGRSNVVLALNVNTWDKLVHIQIYMGHRVAGRLLEGLQAERETIESELGQALEWNPNPQKLDKVIRLVRPGDIDDREQWTELAGWFSEKAVAFQRTFGPRIRSLV